MKRLEVHMNMPHTYIDMPQESSQVLSTYLCTKDLRNTLHLVQECIYLHDAEHVQAKVDRECLTEGPKLGFRDTRLSVPGTGKEHGADQFPKS